MALFSSTPDGEFLAQKTVLYQNTSLDVLSFDVLEENQSYHFFGYGKISLHHVIAKVLGFVGASDLHLLTWSLSSPAMKCLVNLKQSGLIVKSVAGLDKRAPNDHADAYKMALNYFDEISICSNHSKVVVLDNPTMPVAITGSANLTNNPKQEYFMVSTNVGLCQFLKQNIIQTMQSGIAAIV